MAAIGNDPSGPHSQVSLVAGPALTGVIGVPGIFVLTGVLALLAIALLDRVVPMRRRATAMAPGNGSACCAIHSSSALTTASSPCMPR